MIVEMHISTESKKSSSSRMMLLGQKYSTGYVLYQEKDIPCMCPAFFSIYKHLGDLVDCARLSKNIVI